MKSKGVTVINKRIRLIDLILNINGNEIVCEVKAVKRRAFMNAVRDAVGQLLYYTYIYEKKLENPKKVILLDGFPGEFLINWVHLFKIGVIWKTNNSYSCCDLANEYGFEF